MVHDKQRKRVFPSHLETKLGGDLANELELILHRFTRDKPKRFRRRVFERSEHYPKPEVRFY